MHRRIISGLVISALVMAVVLSGCISGSMQEKPALPAGEKNTAAVHTGADTRATNPATRAVETAAPVLPAGLREHTFSYVLGGVKDTVSVPLSDPMYADYAKKADPAYSPPYNARTNSSYFLSYMNDPEQQPAIAALAQAIAEKSPNKDDQARIAVSLVQHIPYKEGGKQYRYPYEVLYNNQGVCGEKSMLLALLLKHLGFGSAVFYLLPEDHMTAGIRVSPPYDFRSSGYAFVEATEPFIITDSTTDSLAQWKFASTMEVFPVGTGQALQSIADDYHDAQVYAALKAKNSLSPSEYQELQALNTKYDKGYHT